MTVATGTRLGPYEIGSRIDAGGMGEVFRATDTRLDRSVAIKVLPPSHAQDAQFALASNERATIPLTFTGNDVIAGKMVPLCTPPAKDHAILAATHKGFAMGTVPDPSDCISLLHYESSPLDR